MLDTKKFKRVKIQIYYSHILGWSLFAQLSMSKVENYSKLVLESFFI